MPQKHLIPDQQIMAWLVFGNRMLIEYNTAQIMAAAKLGH
jgi:hypothetical protein